MWSAISSRCCAVWSCTLHPRKRPLFSRVYHDPIDVRLTASNTNDVWSSQTESLRHNYMMTPTHETLLGLLPWDEDKTSPCSALSGLRLLSSSNYPGICVICRSECATVITYTMRDDRPRRSLTDVCTFCHHPMYSMCRSYMQDSPSSTVLEAIRAVGRSLLIALNLTRLSAGLRTNVSADDPTACEWCHARHHDHTLCKMELLWVLANVSPTRDRINLVVYLPLVQDTQKIIMDFLLRSSGAIYTPQLVGSAILPDLRYAITHVTSPSFIVKCEKFAAIHDAVMLWVASHRLSVVPTCNRQYLSYHIYMSAQTRGNGDRTVARIVYDTHETIEGYDHPIFTLTLNDDSPPFTAITMEDYWATVGLSILWWRGTYEVCRVCSQEVIIKEFAECLNCYEVRRSRFPLQ